MRLGYPKQERKEQKFQKSNMMPDDLTLHDFGGFPLWELQIEAVETHNLESKGKEDVNAMLSDGWVLLHVYTLKYREDDVWRERPMAILGRPRNKLAVAKKAEENIS